MYLKIAEIQICLFYGYNSLDSFTFTIQTNINVHKTMSKSIKYRNRIESMYDCTYVYGFYMDMVVGYT